MKIENNIFWFELDKNHVIARGHISSVYHDRENKKWIIKYTGGYREFEEKEGKKIADRLGLRA